MSITELEQNVVEAQEALDSTNKTLEASQAASDNANAEVSEAQQKLDSAKEELKGATKSNKSALKGNVTKCDKALKKLTQAADSANDVLEAATNAVSESQDALDAATSSLEEAKSDSNDEPEEDQPVQIDPHHCAFFKQYIDNLKNMNPDRAILSLNNCVKNMLTHKDESAFDDVLDLFSEEKKFLSAKTILQSAANIPAADRAKLETVATIFHILVNKKDAKMNLDHVRNVVKNAAFVNWLAKKIRK